MFTQKNRRYFRLVYCFYQKQPLTLKYKLFFNKFMKKLLTFCLLLLANLSIQAQVGPDLKVKKQDLEGKKLHLVYSNEHMHYYAVDFSEYPEYTADYFLKSLHSESKFSPATVLNKEQILVLSSHNSYDKNEVQNRILFLLNESTQKANQADTEAKEKLKSQKKY